MKERINLVLTDLDDFELTFKQLILVIDKILVYYSEQNINAFMSFVERFMIYFYMFHQLIEEAKGEDKNED
jgi:hypothetical protein